jgi:dTDP-4-amino-4,6-dideoxygalactose transaminase
MNGLQIPFTGLKKQYHNLRSEILDVTDEVLRSGQLMNGNYTAEFENWLAKKNQTKYAVTVHSGTHALECLAEYYVETRPLNTNRPIALIPTLTYAATANAFIRAGWDVHFIDTDSYGIFDVHKIPNMIWYDAVVLVGLYGAGITHMGDLKTWREWTMNNRIVIEDAAQHWLSSDCLRIGNASAISFDPMKNLPCYGNGGAIVTNDSQLFHFARAWRDNGKTTHDSTGTNSRMSEIDCAQMMVKTRYIDSWQQRRETIASHWCERLREANIRSLISKDNFHEHSFHKFVIDTDNRDILQRNLALRKVETKIHYQLPLHEVGNFRQYLGPDILSSASALSRRVLSLPIYPELTDLEVEYVIDQVRDCA